MRMSRQTSSTPHWRSPEAMSVAVRKSWHGDDVTEEARGEAELRAVTTASSGRKQVEREGQWGGRGAQRSEEGRGGAGDKGADARSAER